MKSAALWFAILLPLSGLAQSSYVRWGNTSTTRVFTNDCGGGIGPISGAGAYRFGLYIGPRGAPADSLVPILLATNGAVPGLFGTINPSSFPPMFPPATPLTFQVRGWPSSAGQSYEEALLSPSPVGPLGVSEVGYFTPGTDQFNAPFLFGNGPGQIGGFDLTSGICRALVTRRMAPDGPVRFTHFTRGGESTWTNVLASDAIYRFYVSSGVTGPYGNHTTITAASAQVTFTNPYSGPSLFFKLEWIHAPLPQPLGTWDYQAFDAAGAVMAAGIFTFTSNVPGTITRNFSRIQNHGPANLHPSGAGTLEAASAGSSSNLLELTYGSDFRLRGQMVGNYYAGDWFLIDYLSFPPEEPPPPGTPLFIIRSGRFVAVKRP